MRELREAADILPLKPLPKLRHARPGSRMGLALGPVWLLPFERRGGLNSAHQVFSLLGHHTCSNWAEGK
jgi:hypothetical protein